MQCVRHKETQGEVSMKSQTEAQKLGERGGPGQVLNEVWWEGWIQKSMNASCLIGGDREGERE